MIPEEDGELVVTVEGTESRDRKNFALYCGENSWEYRLEIAGNLITPEENQAILDGWSEAQDVNILPENSIDLCAGEYWECWCSMWCMRAESRILKWKLIKIII